MTVEEIKSEISKSLERVPTSILKDVLSFLKAAEKQPKEFDVANNLRKIIKEDAELLAKLAK